VSAPVRSRLAQALDRAFGVSAAGGSLSGELLGGVVTFLSMSYIVFVQPAVLSGAMFGAPTGMDFRAVLAATCLSAALATAIMGLLARLPIAQAPGMGENFFFALTLLPAAQAAGLPEPWQVGLGVIFWSGVGFLAICVSGVRRQVTEALPPSLRAAIAAGIGLFIALIGLRGATLVRVENGLSLNPDFGSPDLIVFFAALLATAALHVRGSRGAILWGMALATGLAAALQQLLPAEALEGSLLQTRFGVAREVLAAPPSLAPTFLRLDLAGALAPAMLPFIAVFLVMVMLDAIGTIVAVTERAGLARDDRTRQGRALVSDALGTIGGACLGTSTVTSFIESATGVEAGARTGLAALVVAALFLAALFFGPLVEMIGSYPPITAPALVLVGALMLRSVRDIDWSDPSESLPAFLIVLGVPATYSIADGLSLGFIAYPLLKLARGQGRAVHPVLWALALGLLLYFVLVRGELG
jgi:AGZA family xanthine/uracil permease-like MFS transporter